MPRELPGGGNLGGEVTQGYARRLGVEQHDQLVGVPSGYSTGPALSFTGVHWAAFIARVRDGEFDWLRSPGSSVFPVPPCTARWSPARGASMRVRLVIPSLGHRVGGFYVSAPMTGRHGRRFHIGHRLPGGFWLSAPVTPEGSDAQRARSGPCPSP
jgi:hypothetical protein